MSKNSMTDFYIAERNRKIQDIPETDVVGYDPWVDTGDDLDTSTLEVLSMIEEVIRIQDKIRKARDRAHSQLMYQEELSSKSGHLKDARRSDDMKMYVSLTVNPPPDVSPRSFISAVHNLFSSKVVEFGCYVFEQRGEEEGDYHGLHSHMFFKRGSKPCEVWKRIKSSFNDIVGESNIHNRHFINLRSTDVMNNERNYYTKYMDGKKKDQSKIAKVLNDTRMRSAYSLDKKYFKGASNLLLDAPVGPCSSVTDVTDYDSE